VDEIASLHYIQTVPIYRFRKE